MQNMTMEELQKEVTNLKGDVEFLKQHLDEEPKEAYVRKIKKIEQRAKFLDVPDFAKKFRLK